MYEQAVNGTPINKKIVRNGIASEFANIVMMTVSTGILGWALLRIRRQVRDNNGLDLNTRMMQFHIAMMSLNLLTEIVVWGYLEYVALHGLINMLAYADIVDFLMQAVVQIVCVVLMLNISKIWS